MHLYNFWLVIGGVTLVFDTIKNLRYLIETISVNIRIGEMK